DILCVVNVQHNCYDQKCPVKQTRTMYQEREISNEKEHRIEHIEPGSLILNMAQMRSAAYLM
ncbi:MAG: hypothetical protein NXY57DRAFT_863090, partial [Lentinula lateritia]